MGSVKEAAVAPPAVGCGVGLDGLGADALLEVVERALARLGEQVLGGRSATRRWRCRWRVCTGWRPWAHAEKLRRVAEIDSRRAYVGQAARSTADLLAARLGLTRTEARTQAARRRRWRGCRGPP